jgi:hypothetical protein
LFYIELAYSFAAITLIGLLASTLAKYKRVRRKKASNIKCLGKKN